MPTPIQNLLAYSTGPAVALGNTGGVQQSSGSNPSRQLQLNLDPNYFALSVDQTNGVNNVSGGPAISAANYADQGTIVAPPVAALWTPDNFGAGTTIIDRGRPGMPTVFLSDYTTGGAQVLRGAYVSKPGALSGSYTLVCAFRPALVPDNTAGHNSSCGVYISDGTRYISFQYTYAQSAMDGQVVQFNSANSAHGNAYTANWNLGLNARVWFKLQNDGTHRNYTWAAEGQNFLPPTAILQELNSTWINNGETRIGLMTSPINSIGAGITCESWNLQPGVF